MSSGQPFPRTLLADTGAGSQASLYELILEENDCLLCGVPYLSVRLSGAYVGWFPVYTLDVQLPALGFTQSVRAVGVPSVPRGFDGLACFRFLNRFTFGNFGDPSQFGLES
jgi:hypothetical protein